MVNGPRKCPHPQSIQESKFKALLNYQQGRKCIIGAGNHYDFYFGSNKYFGSKNKTPASGFISYTDSVRRKYKEAFTIDFAVYANMYFAVGHDENTEKLLKEQNRKLDEISKGLENLCKSITAKTDQDVNQ